MIKIHTKNQLKKIDHKKLILLVLSVKSNKKKNQFFTKMNIMNFTQPNFYSSSLQRNQNPDDATQNKASFHIQFSTDIGKSPQSIRKSINQNRHKYNTFKNFISQQIGDCLIEEMDTKEACLTKQKKIFLINSRKLKNYSISRKYQTTFDDFVRAQKQNAKTFMHEIRKRLKKETQKSQRNKGPGRDTFEQRIRRLSPLKHGSLIIEKKGPSKQLEITFLNIQKAPLTKMYETVREQEQFKMRSKNNSCKTWNPPQIIEPVFHNFNMDSIEDFTPVSKFSMRVQMTTRNKTISENFPVSKLRTKKFVVPFQRYYYRDFLWKVAYSNGLLLQCPKQYDKKFKVFIGKGNNSMLIKSLMKRRYSWWTITEKYEEANFIWTQIKINDVFKSQLSSLQTTKKLSNETIAFTQNNEVMKKMPINNNNEKNRKILNDQQSQRYQQYLQKHIKIQESLDGTMRKRNRIIKRGQPLSELNSSIQITKIHNHLPNNYIIGNKKALYYTMTTYYEKMGVDPFDYLPETYHIQNGLQDQQYSKFLKRFYQQKKRTQKQQRERSPEKQRTRNMWIVKPGEFSNRGNGITVCLTLDEIKSLLRRKQRHQNGNPKTYILQSYIDKPFLYQRRKFDIRHYMMVTSVNGRIKGYWYQLGYIRTTSYGYSTKTGLSSIHLTNDAVQKNLPDYGRYEKGNKLTYAEFQAYLEKEYNGTYNFFHHIYPLMKKIATDAIRASSLLIDPQRNLNNFEVFGLDFMIDHNFAPWLIQINNNPCLQLSCPHLAEIIPAMVQNAIKICVDSLVPPPATFQQKRPKFSDNVLQSNKFQLVYDSFNQEAEIQRLLHGQKITEQIKQLQNQQDEVFQDDGNQLQD